MNKQNTIRTNIFGLWVFGLLTGANVRQYLPGEPSLPAWVLVAIGLVGSLLMFATLYKATRDS